MHQILLIRHGKASPAGEDYDVLSETGIRQAQLTGAWLSASGTALATSYVGPLRRQHDTWQAMRTQAGPAADAWPTPQVLPGLAEAPMVELIRQVLPRRLPHDPALQRMMLALERCQDRTERQACFSALYRHIVQLWCDAQLPDESIETYEAFVTRVGQALQTIAERAGHTPGHTALVSSMGAIAELLKQALGWSQERMLVESEAIANASITTLGYDGTRFSLLGFNSIEHLQAHDLVTYI